MVEHIAPNSVTFRQATQVLQNNIGTLLTQTLDNVTYDTRFEAQKNSWSILCYSTTLTIKVGEMHTYHIIDEEIIDDFELQGRNIPKPLALIKIHETNPDIVVLDIIEVEESLHGKGIGSGLLNNIERIMKEKGYKYMLSVHYHEESIGFFKHRGFSRAIESEIASYPEVQVYTNTEHQEECIILVKIL